MGHKTFTASDAAPNIDDIPNGTIAVVNYGDYHDQEVWVASGANIGNWYPLGNEFGAPCQRKGQIRIHPTWRDLVARGPVTILAPSDEDAYDQGWNDGRRRLFEQVEDLRDGESR